MEGVVEEKSKSESTMKKLSAIVIGGTGAIGENVVLELLKSPRFEKVITVGRREFKLADDSLKAKLQQKVINMDKLEDEKEIFQNHDVSFCCLGTTRKDAGSAEAFKKIDYHLVTQFAKMSKDANIPQFHVVSSQGANANSFFLYMATKGQADEYISKLGFERTCIYRPGFLDRPNTSRLGEKFLGFFMKGVAVSVVARAIVRTSLDQADNPKKQIDIFSDSQIRAIGKDPL